MNKLPEVDFKKGKKNPTLDSDNSYFELPFYKDAEYLSILENFVGFVKACERMIRSNKAYSRYIKFMKEDMGMDFCQVLSNIKIDDEKQATEIEMHHGPILTLFDYVSIVIDYLLYHNEKINTFIVSDIIINEHYKHNIQVVMLSKTVHEQVHQDNIFINLNQAFGDLNKFLTKYRDGISQEQVDKINQYIELSKKYNSYDKEGVLELKKTLKSWKNY